ncbi:MAG: class I SAM-dependent methyltransferase [Nocardioides sp.]|uniref:class I SAM-dependent methyltransferase n=1 Tax=Nocardioides sp. TaxID=35761 RepID=UPI003F11E395
MSRADLHDVPETALWTLRNRAEEALRPGSRFPDPEAVRLYRALAGEDFSRFGRPGPGHSQRAAAFDAVVRGFLDEHPSGPVVALGEGLQTAYWRLGRPDVAWYSVDLPESVVLAERLLPAEPAVRRLAMSALDRAWLDEVPAGPALVSAEGLFMYLPREEVHALVADCAARFPGGRLVYDSVPPWFSAMTLRGKARLSKAYTTPPMPHSQRSSDLAAVVEAIPGVVAGHEVPVPPARPWDKALLRVADLPGVRDLRPTISVLEFAG